MLSKCIIEDIVADAEKIPSLERCKQSLPLPYKEAPITNQSILPLKLNLGIKEYEAVIEHD